MRSVTFDPVESRVEASKLLVLLLFIIIFFFLSFLIMPHHPESTDVKQKLETALIQGEGHPNIALLTAGPEP